jgi:hypothetical protein
MNAQFKPTILVGTAGTTAATLAFSGIQGSVIIENLDGTNAVFIRWDGTPPVASNTNGTWQLSAGKALSLDAVEVASIGYICAAGSPVIQALGFPTSTTQGASA